MREKEYRSMFDLEDRLWWYSGMRAITASILSRGAGGRLQGRLLDVGCGTGYSMLWMKERFSLTEVFGSDFSQTAASHWKLKDIDRAAVASASALPFGSEEFDVVTCFDVIYQFDSQEAREAVSEFRRVLKPGGLLFIREPAYDWLRGGHDIAVGTRHRYTRPELKGLLTSQGFSIRYATYANTLLFGLAATHRLLSRARGTGASDVRQASRPVNAVFGAALKAEARLLGRLSLPFGLSVIALAERAD